MQKKKKQSPAFEENHPDGPGSLFCKARPRLPRFVTLSPQHHQSTRTLLARLTGQRGQSPNKCRDRPMGQWPSVAAQQDPSFKFFTTVNWYHCPVLGLTGWPGGRGGKVRERLAPTGLGADLSPPPATWHRMFLFSFRRFELQKIAGVAPCG